MYSFLETVETLLQLWTEDCEQSHEINSNRYVNVVWNVL